MHCILCVYSVHWPQLRFGFSPVILQRDQNPPNVLCNAIHICITAGGITRRQSYVGPKRLRLCSTDTPKGGRKNEKKKRRRRRNSQTARGPHARGPSVRTLRGKHGSTAPASASGNRRRRIFQLLRTYCCCSEVTNAQLLCLCAE